MVGEPGPGALGQDVEHHVADIVAVAGVPGPGVPQPDDEPGLTHAACPGTDRTQMAQDALKMPAGTSSGLSI